MGMFSMVKLLCCGYGKGLFSLNFWWVLDLSEVFMFSIWLLLLRMVV